MHVTKMADYGVRIMIELASRTPGTRSTAADLSQATGASSAFAGKILQRLVGARLLVSRAGRDGGFELERAPAEISMLDIVTALEGPMCLNDCLPGGPGCARKAWCPGHDVWTNAQAALVGVLAAERLDRLAATGEFNKARLNVTQPVRMIPPGAPADA